MTELDHAWARAQVEAMVDDSLSPEAEQRMRTLMAEDPVLAAEVERAKALRRELRRLARTGAPRGQLRRLWNLPAADRPRAAYWVPASVLATVAAVALVAGLFLGNGRPTPEELAREEAMEDFVIAMAYLQKSALVARNEINEAVGSGVRDAWTVGQGAIRQSVSGGTEGVQDNGD